MCNVCDSHGHARRHFARRECGVVSTKAWQIRGLWDSNFVLIYLLMTQAFSTRIEVHHITFKGVRGTNPHSGPYQWDRTIYFFWGSLVRAKKRDLKIFCMIGLVGHFHRKSLDCPHSTIPLYEAAVGGVPNIKLFWRFSYSAWRWWQIHCNAKTTPHRCDIRS